MLWLKQQAIIQVAGGNDRCGIYMISKHIYNIKTDANLYINARAPLADKNSTIKLKEDMVIFATKYISQIFSIDWWMQR